ncbi:hypothetical protein HY029_01500 [Candidatus Gottesmanbacteria bacterium]|nr:hypothetical protein [Candidatus Gottesmanbacteria bacterium]
MKLSKKQIIIFIVIFLLVVSFLAVILLSKNQRDSQSKITKQLIPTQKPSNSNSQSGNCKSVKLSGRVLSNNKLLNIISETKNPNVIKFLYVFLNLDNIASDSGMPMNIRFDAQKDFKISHKYSEGGLMMDMISINFADIDKPDLNWNSKKPKHIQVNVLFEDNNGNRSVSDPKCEVSFDIE